MGNAPSPTAARSATEWFAAEPGVRREVEAWLSMGSVVHPLPEPRRDGVARATSGLGPELMHEPEVDGGAQRLASNPHRDIILLPPGSTPRLLIKRFRVGSGPNAVREHIKRRFRRGAARREWRALGRLHAAGVAVPRPLGFARLADGDDILVEAYVPGPSFQCWLAAAGPEKRAMSTAVGHLAFSLHAAGWLHHDLHPGNIVIGPKGPVLIDFQRSRPIRSPGSTGSLRARTRELGRLDRALARFGFSICDRLRFRRAALGLSGPPQPEARTALRRIERAGRAAARRHHRNLDRRCTRPSRDFLRVRLDEGTGLRVSRFTAAQAQSAIRAHCLAFGRELHPDALGTHEPPSLDGHARILKADERTRISEVMVEGMGLSVGVGDHGRVVVKEVTKRGFIRGLADLLRGSPARRAWRAGHGLAARGVVAATPLSYVERWRLGRGRRAFVILEHIGSCGADQPESLPAFSTAALAKALYSLLIELREADIHHADLKANNIRLRQRDDGLQAALIDLEDVRFPRRLSNEQQLSQLVTLNASIADPHLSAPERQHLLRRYIARAPLGRPFEEARRLITKRSLERRHVWRATGCPATEGGQPNRTREAPTPR